MLSLSRTRSFHAALRFLALVLPVAICLLLCTRGASAQNLERPRVLLGFNPLPALYGAVGGQAEVLVGGRFGIVGSLHVASATVDTGSWDHSDESSSALSGFGGELGVRYYTRNPNRHVVSLFVGPSVLAGSYSYSKTYTPGYIPDSSRPPPQSTTSSSDFSRYGVAMNFGILVLTKPGFALSVGGGLQYTTGAPDLSLQGGGLFPTVNFTNLAFGAGVRPRVLLTLGWGF